jgi:hypothetical protein
MGHMASFQKTLSLAQASVTIQKRKETTNLHRLLSVQVLCLRLEWLTKRLSMHILTKQSLRSLYTK